jgi:hypothetical protein
MKYLIYEHKAVFNLISGCKVVCEWCAVSCVLYRQLVDVSVIHGSYNTCGIAALARSAFTGAIWCAHIITGIYQLGMGPREVASAQWDEFRLYGHRTFCYRSMSSSCTRCQIGLLAVRWEQRHAARYSPRVTPAPLLFDTIPEYRDVSNAIAHLTRYQM